MSFRGANPATLRKDDGYLLNRYQIFGRKCFRSVELVNDWGAAGITKFFCSGLNFFNQSANANVWANPE